MKAGKPQKPVFVLRSERASWGLLWIVFTYPIYAVILLIVDPNVGRFWPYMAILFLAFLTVPIYSIRWFRQRRREDGVASDSDPSA